ncbi:hypothetical protein [Streptomyces sp. NPDC127190]
MAIFSRLMPADRGHDKDRRDTTSHHDDTTMFRRRHRDRRTDDHSGHRW